MIQALLVRSHFVVFVEASDWPGLGKLALFIAWVSFPSAVFTGAPFANLPLTRIRWFPHVDTKSHDFFCHWRRSLLPAIQQFADRLSLVVVDSVATCFSFAGSFTFTVRRCLPSFNVFANGILIRTVIKPLLPVIIRRSIFVLVTSASTVIFPIYVEVLHWSLKKTK